MQPLGMSANEPTENQDKPDKLAILTADAILQLIYGDDLLGCKVSPDSIAMLVNEALKQHNRHGAELLNLFGKVAEAVHLLSTPPDATKVANPAELQAVLSDRLDRIHTIAQKMVETGALFKK